MADISKAVRVAIAEKGDKQKDVALACGIPASTLSNITKGRINPTCETLGKIAPYFNLKLSELIALGE